MDKSNDLSNYDYILKQNLCENVKNNPKYVDPVKFLEECEEMGDGLLEQGSFLIILLKFVLLGLQPAFSYILIQLNAFFQNRLDMSDIEVYDHIVLAIELIDKNIHDFNIAINDYLISDLIKKNKISLSVLLVLGTILSFAVTMIYSVILENFLKPKILHSRYMLKLVSVNFLSKSAKIAKYLATTSQTLLKKL